MSERYVGCSVRQLPPEKHIEAARTAIRLNPGNKPLQPPGLVPLPVGRLALLTSKWWGAKGVNLTVQFLDNPDAATRSKVLSHANAWGRTANVVFRETASGGQVRIARTPGQGYWSYLGTDVLHIPPGEPTMNLDSFTAQGTPDSEFYRVVRHEAGHTLGFPHEHTRKEIVNRIDPARAVAYFGRTQGWDEETVRQQVLTPLSDSDLAALPADVLSVMCYSLPSEITIDGKPIPGGEDINDEDYQLCARLYPKGPAGGGRRVFGLRFGRDVRQGAPVSIPAFAAPAEIPAGKYSVVADDLPGQGQGTAGHAGVGPEAGA